MTASTPAFNRGELRQRVTRFSTSKADAFEPNYGRKRERRTTSGIYAEGKLDRRNVEDTMDPGD